MAKRNTRSVALFVFNYINAPNYRYTSIGGVELILNETFIYRKSEEHSKNNSCDTYCTLFSINCLLMS
ncbi:hypothetical protein [Vibrio gallaecicus]|uniref:hypothetical protein n=1 Tax=Vibrio gallaecicus TaxID=552386 RepID=UPI0025B39F5C|nr:hypothetical protein [Vibrio gallaecicus]MDN3615772.1 hypothetical protein [Vibrio gallaecicus]MDN3615896.1 hypothetical protein [Vibrio gallaecicus]MDN3617736.1 hypothetical protein [Vibrio gallaecicus]